MRNLTHWLLESVWRATLVAVIGYIVPLLLVLAISIQALVTLRQGMQKGLIVTLASCVLGILLANLINSLFVDTSYSNFINSLQWGLILSLPVWLIASILRKTVSLSLTFQVMTLGYIMIFMTMALTNIHILPENIRQPISINVSNLTTTFVETQKQLNLQTEGVESSNLLAPEEIIQLNNFLVQLFEITSIYMLQLVIILLARFWQSMVFKPRGFRDEFVNLRAGTFISVLVVSSIVLLAFVQNLTVSCLLSGIVFITALFLTVVGLGLVHWTINYYNFPWLAVLIFYLTLLLPVISGLLLFIVIIAALVDGIIDTRSVIRKANIRT